MTSLEQNHGKAAIAELAKSPLGRRTLRSLNNWLNHAQGRGLDDVQQRAAATIVKLAWQPGRRTTLDLLRDEVAKL